VLANVRIEFLQFDTDSFNQMEEVKMREKMVLRKDNLVFGIYYDFPDIENKWQGYFVVGGPLVFEAHMQEIIKIGLELSPRGKDMGRIDDQKGNKGQFRVSRVSPICWKRIKRKISRTFETQVIRNFRRLMG